MAADSPHSHGLIPVQTRSERFKSYKAAEFPEISNREEAWRYLPVDRLRGLESGQIAELDSKLIEISAPATVIHSWVNVGAAELQSFAIPEDLVAAQIWGAVERALLIEIPANVELAEPVILKISAPESAAGLRVLIRTEPHATATVILDHTGSGVLGEFIELDLKPGSALNLVSLQDWQSGATHISNQFARLGRDSRLKHVAVSTGGALVRLVPSVRLAEPGCAVELYGVYLAQSGDYIEHRPFVDHVAANCSSRVSYKGALHGKGAHTVWVGDVLIRESAEGTDTYEVNRNLLLTDGARADSVPNLEIETGKITGAGHASASGRFDDEQLFYLMARGVSESEAKRLVVRGFLADVVLQIGEAAIQERIMERIEAELDGLGS